MASTAQQLSPQSLDQGLGDWLSGATCDDILFGTGGCLGPEEIAGVPAARHRLRAWTAPAAPRSCACFVRFTVHPADGVQGLAAGPWKRHSMMRRHSYRTTKRLRGRCVRAVSGSRANCSARHSQPPHLWSFRLRLDVFVTRRRSWKRCRQLDCTGLVQ